MVHKPPNTGPAIHPTGLHFTDSEPTAQLAFHQPDRVALVVGNQADDEATGS